MLPAHGIDLSNNQVIEPGEWLGHDFGFAKATERLDFIDHTFAARWATMRDQLPARGAYHFLHPSLSGKAQAEFMWRVVSAQGVRHGDMLVVDSEITSGLAPALRPARAQSRPSRQDHVARVPLRASVVATETRACLDRLHTLAGPGIKVILYTDLAVAGMLGNCTSYPLWIANPGSHWPESVAPWKRGRETNPFWQNSFGPPDADTYAGTQRQLLEWLGLLPPPAPKTHPLLEDPMTISRADFTAADGTLRGVPLAFPDGAKSVRFFTNSDVQIRVDTRAKGADLKALHLTYDSAEPVAVPAKVHAFVVHLAPTETTWDGLISVAVST